MAPSLAGEEYEATPASGNVKGGGGKGRSRQDPALVQRVCALCRSGRSLRQVDQALHAEGFHNSKGQLWPPKSDGSVLRRILLAAGVPVTSSARAKGFADMGAAVDDGCAAGAHGGNSWERALLQVLWEPHAVCVSLNVASGVGCLYTVENRYPLAAPHRRGRRVLRGGWTRRAAWSGAMSTTSTTFSVMSHWKPRLPAARPAGNPLRAASSCCMVVHAKAYSLRTCALLRRL